MGRWIMHILEGRRPDTVRLGYSHTILACHVAECPTTWQLRIGAELCFLSLQWTGKLTCLLQTTHMRSLAAQIQYCAKSPAEEQCKAQILTCLGFITKVPTAAATSHTPAHPTRQSVVLMNTTCSEKGQSDTANEVFGSLMGLL